MGNAEMWAVLILSLYGVGLIWSVQLIIFPSWRMLADADQLYRIRLDYWRKLPYLVFIPIGILFIMTILLVIIHPPSAPPGLLWAALIVQLIINILTGLTWARWERRISMERLTPGDPLLERLVKTHWLRTLLVTMNALFIIWAAVRDFS